MDTYGPQTAASIASFSSVTRPGAALPWQNPSDAWTENGVYAAMAGSYDGGATEWLKVVDWGFAIPTSDRIEQVGVEFIRQVAPVPSRPAENYVVDSALRLVIGGAIVGTDRADVATHWAETWETITYTYDLADWGVSLTPAEVNAADFGLVYAVTCWARALEFAPAQIDQVRMAVYTEPAAQPIWLRASQVAGMRVWQPGRR